MNPCPCGYLGSSQKACRCTPDQVARYQGKLSGPLVDRIDLHVEVPALRESDLEAGVAGESTTAVRVRVAAAHAQQLARQGKPNARLCGDEIERHCVPEDAARKLLRDSSARFGLSARAFHRTLKVARTIADLASSGRLRSAHVAEALQYLMLHIAHAGEGYALQQRRDVKRTSALGWT